MTIEIDPERLFRAKRAFTTRNVDASSLQRVWFDDMAPVAGDLVLARVVSIGAHRRLELSTSRRATLFPNDEVVVAYGNRYAPDQFEAYVPETLGPCELVAAGGIAARVASKSERIEEATRIEPLGLFVDQDRRALNLRDFSLEPTSMSRKIPGIAVVGASMNAGKTTTAASLVKGLTLAGYRVGAAKLTGTGAGNDYWHLRDAGAIRVLDFTDAGLPTTYKASPADLESCARTLSAHLIEAGADVQVFEIADSLFQEETAWLVQSPIMQHLADGYIYAGESAASTAMGVQWLNGHGAVLGVSGVVSLSPLAAREAEAATGCICYAKEVLSTAEVGQKLMETIGAGDTRRAA